MPAEPPAPREHVVGDTFESWPVVATEDVHRDDWVIALRRDTIHAPADPAETFDRLVLEHPGAVVILALDEQDRVLCLWQYRHPAQRRFLEVPAGLIDTPDEDPIEVARRELREEAQLRAEDWTHLTSLYSSPGISSEVMHLYLARDLSPEDRGDFELHHEELDMVTDWVAFEELYAAVLDGRITDGPLIAGVLLARARGLVA
ncbi:NUDIX hydrolase [Nocardioides salsibiostraticola]